MYDPMVAKLIVWDVDREQATARMVRALGEYEIGGLKTLIPFHVALLQTEQWANGETCRDLLEDKEWLKTLAFPKAEKPKDDDGEADETVEQTYTVEVSGRKFDVRVIGPPFGGSVNGAAPRRRPEAPARAARRQRRGRRQRRAASPPCRATCGRCWSRRGRPSRRASSSASSRR